MRKMLALCAAVAGAVLVFALHQVPTGTTAEDAKAIDRLLPEPHGAPRSFNEEVALILRVQDRVLAA